MLNFRGWFGLAIALLQKGGMNDWASVESPTDQDCPTYSWNLNADGIETFYVGGHLCSTVDGRIV